MAFQMIEQHRLLLIRLLTHSSKEAGAIYLWYKTVVHRFCRVISLQLDFLPALLQTKKGFLSPTHQATLGLREHPRKSREQHDCLLFLPK
jgi:hypothetical protein